MFRIRDPQESLWQSQFLVTPKKAKRLERSWAEVFRDEERFAPMYCVDDGRPNRAVQTVLGVHLLKEMFNLTDDEALEQLEFNLLWHHALRLDIEETHLPQKTLHNFRVRLMQHDGGRLAFQETTDRIIQALGIRTGKQRLDSTHIMSNIATLTRLGLFCETMRLFLRALRWEHPELRPGVPEGLLGRYLKEEDEATHYEDARTGEGRRRRRRAEATEEWRKRYDIRAGIEGTNSELKRAHGLGRLRVRGGRRVRLAVYLKALACNFKRMVHARLVEMENTAHRAVGTVPAVAAA